MLEEDDLKKEIKIIKEEKEKKKFNEETQK
jgi:hypothetical protein